MKENVRKVHMIIERSFFKTSSHFSIGYRPFSWYFNKDTADYFNDFMLNFSSLPIHFVSSKSYSQLSHNFGDMRWHIACLVISALIVSGFFIKVPSDGSYCLNYVPTFRKESRA